MAVKPQKGAGWDLETALEAVTPLARILGNYGLGSYIPSDLHHKQRLSLFASIYIRNR